MSEDKQYFVMSHDMARRRAMDAVMRAPENYAVVISPPKRSLEQNATMWGILQAFSEQVEWPVNGQLVTMTPDEWKDVLTAGFQQETVRLAQGLDGGIVMLGLRTSKMTVKRFSEWIEFLYAAAAMRGVVVHPEDRHGH